MTRRDLQRGDGRSEEALGDRQELRPVRSASARFIWLRRPEHFAEGAIWLKVNGADQAEANLNQMIWSVAEQISKLSEAFELMPGDIIYSGTPENVGPVVKGDVIVPHRRPARTLGVKIV